MMDVTGSLQAFIQSEGLGQHRAWWEIRDSAEAQVPTTSL